MLISTKNVKVSFQNNRANITNVTGELCKIGKNKVINTVESIVLN